MLLLFHHTVQRMLMFSRKVHHLCHLGFGDLVRKNAALSDPMMMNMQHDLCRGFNVLLKEFLKNVNDELHWRVIVVQNKYAIQIRTFRLRLDFCDDGRSRAASAAPAIVLARSGIESGMFATGSPIKRDHRWM